MSRQLRVPALAGCIVLVALLAGSSFGRAGTIANDASAKDEVEPEQEAVAAITIEGTMPSRAGERSLTLAADYERSKGSTLAHLPVVGLNLGLTDFLDVTLEVPFLSTSDKRTVYGLGDVSATFKWLVVEERKRLPALVLGMEGAFPTGSVRRGLGGGAYELRPFLAALKTFGPVVVQGNIGWSRLLTARRGECGESIDAGVSLAAPLIARKLYGFAELSGSKVVNRRTSIVTVAPGLRWIWSSGTSVTVALPIPVSGDGSGVGIATSFEWEF